MRPGLETKPLVRRNATRKVPTLQTVSNTASAAGSVAMDRMQGSSGAHISPLSAGHKQKVGDQQGMAPRATNRLTVRHEAFDGWMQSGGDNARIQRMRREVAIQRVAGNGAMNSVQELDGSSQDDDLLQDVSLLLEDSSSRKSTESSSNYSVSTVASSGGTGSQRSVEDETPLANPGRPHVNTLSDAQFKLNRAKLLRGKNPMDSGKTLQERLEFFQGRHKASNIGMNRMTAEVRESLRPLLVNNNDGYRELKKFAGESRNPLRSFTTGMNLARHLKNNPLQDKPSPGLKKALEAFQAWEDANNDEIQRFGGVGYQNEDPLAGKTWSDETFDDLMARMAEGILLNDAIGDEIEASLKSCRTMEPRRTLGQVVRDKFSRGRKSDESGSENDAGQGGSRTAAKSLMKSLKKASEVFELKHLFVGSEDEAAPSMPSISRPTAPANIQHNVRPPVAASSAVQPMSLEMGDTPEAKVAFFCDMLLGQTDLVLKKMGNADVRDEVRASLLARNEFDPSSVAGKAIRSFTTGMQIVDMVKKSPLTQSPPQNVARGFAELTNWWEMRGKEMRPLGDARRTAGQAEPLGEADVDQRMEWFEQGVFLMASLRQELERAGFGSEATPKKAQRANA